MKNLKVLVNILETNLGQIIGKDYKLIDFDWKPFKPEDKNQGKLL